MTGLNRKVTPDDILLMNTVCKGMPMDFTTQFISRIPQVLEVADCLGWVHGAVPEVTAGDYEFFNVVLLVEGGAKRVVGSVGYLNRYELNIEDPDDRQGVEIVTDEYEDITTFYTGWAFSEHDSHEDINTWDFIESERVIAWKVLPKYIEPKTR